VGIKKLLLCAAITALPCFAPRADELEQEFREHIAKLREQNKIASTPAAEAPSAEAPALNASNDPDMFNIPATSHVRSNEGIPFAKQDELVLDPEPPAYMEAIRFGKQTYIPPLPKMPYRRPGKCESNQTKRTPLISPIDGDERLLSDVVYLPQELIPADGEEVYGKRARLWGYGPNGDASVDIRMENDSVPCVPYRIRVTTKATYADFGMSALKNYDNNPGGSGTLNSWVQQQLTGRQPAPALPPRRR